MAFTPGLGARPAVLAKSGPRRCPAPWVLRPCSSSAGCLSPRNAAHLDIVAISASQPFSQRAHRVTGSFAERKWVEAWTASSEKEEEKSLMGGSRLQKVGEGGGEE